MTGTRPTVVIVGGGTAGWMTAAALARFVPEGTPIRLVESDAIGTVGVGEATIPQLRLFNAALGLDEDDFLRATQGTFKLGVQFEGWMGADSRYIHAFGSIGRSHGLLPFFPYWLRHRAEGGTTSLWDYSTNAQAAWGRRFGRERGTPQAPSGLAWAFHFDAGLYAAYLRRYAEARGVERIEGRVVGIEQHAEDGRIAALVLEGERRIPGDLFVDCSGFRGLLIEETLASGFEDWSGYLPCDRALAVASAREPAPTPYTRAIAHHAGWRWRIALQHRTGNGIVYSSAHLGDDQAAEMLLTALGEEALGDPRPLRFTAGKRRRAWVKNCVAMGLAGGFLEPIESTSIHLVQSAITRLLQFWPNERIAEADVAEYNRQTDREWEAVRDFLVLHYHANGRDERFWRERREATIPDRLAQRLELFRANGRIARDPDDLFTEVAWAQVLTGQQIVPAAYPALADALPADAFAAFLATARDHARAIADRLPPHQAFITRHCAAAPARVAA